jgi:hypothetical protein
MCVNSLFWLYRSDEKESENQRQQISVKTLAPFVLLQLWTSLADHPQKTIPLSMLQLILSINCMIHVNGKWNKDFDPRRPDWGQACARLLRLRRAPALSR